MGRSARHALQEIVQSAGSPPGDLAVPPANHGYRTVNLRPPRRTPRHHTRGRPRHRQTPSPTTIPQQRWQDHGHRRSRRAAPQTPARAVTARSPVGHRGDIATLRARVAELEAELAKAEERSAGHRADFERERDRTDQMVTAQDRLITELENLRALLQTAQQPATPQPASRLVRAWRWMRATA